VKEKIKKFFQKCFLFYLAVGGVIWIAGEVDRYMRKDELSYLKITIWGEKNFDMFFVEDKGKIREIKEMFNSFRSLGKVVWFGVPDTEKCPVEVWDNYEEQFYELCRAKDGKWYVALPGSWKGRSTTNYYEVSEKEAQKLIDRIRTEVGGVN